MNNKQQLNNSMVIKMNRKVRSSCNPANATVASDCGITKKVRGGLIIPMIDKHFDDGRDDVYSEYSSIARGSRSSNQFNDFE